MQKSTAITTLATISRQQVVTTNISPTASQLIVATQSSSIKPSSVDIATASPHSALNAVAIGIVAIISLLLVLGVGIGLRTWCKRRRLSEVHEYQLNKSSDSAPHQKSYLGFQERVDELERDIQLILFPKDLESHYSHNTSSSSIYSLECTESEADLGSHDKVSESLLEHATPRQRYHFEECRRVPGGLMQGEWIYLPISETATPKT